MAELINRFSNKPSDNMAYSEGFYKNIKTKNYPVDYNSPLSYSDWLKYQTSIEPNNRYSQYLNYIVVWYENKVGKTITPQILHNSYLNVIQSLSLIFNDEIQEEWVKELNFDNDIDVLDSIEFYSKKLKQIAFYYINKRNDSQNAKIKYNMVGSEDGLKSLFSDYILKTFTKRDNVLNLTDQEIYNNIPSLSSVSKNAKIIIEEYYDTTNYFDKSPNVDIKEYFNTEFNEEFLKENDIQINPDDLYSMGVIDKTPNSKVNFLDTEFLELSSYSDSLNLETLDEILIKISEKFIGAIHDRLEIYETLTNTISVVYDINAGNNLFFWPSGEYFTEQNNLDVGEIFLNETSLISNGATFSDNYKKADKIFLKKGNDVKGAWLKITPNSTEIKNISADLTPQETFWFKWPYPGYGDAAPTLNWTGPSISNINALYNFVDEETQKYIEKEYFEDTTFLSDLSTTPININNSTLIYSSISAGKTYRTSSKIERRLTTNPNGIQDESPSSVYNSSYDNSWLYDFDKTDISVSVGQNNILWPFKTVNRNEDFPFIIKNICNPVSLSSIKINELLGCVAGQGLHDSDIIYKLNSYGSYSKECSYLWGPELSSFNISQTKFTSEAIGTVQPSLNVICESGVYTTFLWLGSSTPINNTNIKYHKPLEDSQFLNIRHNSIFEERNLTLNKIQENSIIPSNEDYGEFGVGSGVGNWKTDEYRTPLFSPIGHIGNTFDDYNRMSDYIFVDWTYPEPFSFETWRDNEGRDYKNSPDFAWFKISDPVQPDVGWGEGEWVTYNSLSSFELKEGLQYKYFRNNLNRNESELSQNAVPSLIIRESFNIPSDTFEWKNCVLTSNSEWSETDSTSPMVLNEGEILLYDHIETTTYCVSTLDTRGFRIESAGPFSATSDFQYWVDYSAAPKGTIMSASWPTTYYNSLSVIPVQFEIDTITWSLSSPNETSKIWEDLNSFIPITFVLSLTGEYLLSSTAKLLDGGTYVGPKIPISCYENTTVQILTGDLFYSTISYPNPPVEINVPLHGWDNTNNTFSGEQTSKARPFWAKAFNDDSVKTKYKGIDVYGTNLGFVNTYSKINQPEIADWDLMTGNVIGITQIGGTRPRWIQPVEFVNTDSSIEWKELVFTDKSNPINNFSNINTLSLFVSATDKTSDLILSPYTDSCNDKLEINYFAQNSFTWTQNLSTIFSGTVNIVNSAVDINAIVPYANLLNRHYPTIAFVPDIYNLYTKKELGILKPSNIGFTRFYSYNHFPSLSTTIEISGTYLDVDYYETDYGFTKETNNSIMGYLDYDASWMKWEETTFNKSGIIKNPKPYQKFIPYMNSSEYKLTDNSSIDYEFDPWYGDEDKTWRDAEEFPLDFRSQESITQWYQKNTSPHGVIYQFVDDIYGNKYYLFKTIENEDLYEQRDLDGELWIRTIDNKFGPASSVLVDVFDNYTTAPYKNELDGGKIKEIYCNGDILTVTLSSVVLFENVKYNYNEGFIYSLVDDSYTIPLSSNRLFGDVLYNKDIHCVVSDASNVFNIYTYHMQENDMTVSFPNIRTDYGILSSVLSIPNVEFDRPLLSYNKYTDKYNVSMFANSNLGQYLVSVTMNYVYKYFNIERVDVVSPS